MQEQMTMLRVQPGRRVIALGGKAALAGVVVVMAFILGGVVAIYFAVYVRPSWHHMVSRITSLDAGRVQSVTLLPHPNPAYGSLVATPTVITDAAVIEQIAAACREAQHFSPNHPSGKWWVVVRVVTADESFEFLVSDTLNAGCLVDIYSDVTQGWRIATLRSDALGPLLANMAATGGASSRPVGP
jgi:hypothetical protein